MMGATPQDSSYNTYSHTAIAYGISSFEPCIGRYSTDRGFEGDRGFGEEHDRRVDGDGDGDGDDDDRDNGEDAEDEKQPVPVAPASRCDGWPRHKKEKGLTCSFMSVMNKISGSRNKRSGVTCEVPVPTRRRKKLKGSDVSRQA
ncbi:hypothetical protein M9H77_35490 [Catharanthus roseus]|uniref:Uncharacterized protein n=1 Tax=Catharanthus roseus TaxID=4058 RepID=A0ACB9ZPW3_CATRO|nr:hypothetical protein M9H77_35490 [Catharanthus roseus]